MEAQIQIRRSTAAQWISANPVLTSGEPGLETDTGKGKYGNGTQAWTSLPYSWALLNTGPQGPAGGGLAGSYPNPTIAPASVGSAQIIDGTVGNAELANNAITGPKLADGTVTAAKIGDAQVINAKLGPNAVTTDKILDGTIVTADLAAATVAGLMVDVSDEGTPVATNTTGINFVGAGVTATGAGSVATVTIPGGGTGTAILAGTISQWYDPAPPSGWYICDGTVKADMAGTLGTRYGAVSGTLPAIAAMATDFYTETVADVCNAGSAGWTINSVFARRFSGACTVTIQFTRTGATIALNNPGHADQNVSQLKDPWVPDFNVSGSLLNEPRWMNMTNSGSFGITCGFADAFSNGADILTNTVFTATYVFPVSQAASAPKVYSIIKRP